MNRITVDLNREMPTISKYIYGQFAEHLGRGIYEGVWVGEDSDIPNEKGIRLDVVEALKKIKVPLVRWPGGLFADEYHWKDGIGPKENRTRIVNSYWGETVENNHFGTHEFFDLLELIGADAYVSGNIGSGTVQEMQEWIEYITLPGVSPMAKLRQENGRKEPWRMKFFGIGNESWGGGGHMRPSYYADLYRHYRTYVKNYNDQEIYKIAVGPNIDDYNWTDEVMKIAGPFMDGLSLHHYALASEWEDKRPATNFLEKEWYSLIDSAYKMDEFITKHSTVMDKYDSEKRIGLIVDEWGSWLAVEEDTNPGFLYQQNTIRDAMVASITLNIFHRHADRVHMANIAQMVNVLQAMILTDNDKMIKTPTYHVFDMYKYHQDAQVVDGYGTKSDKIDYTISKKDRKLTISICNFDVENTESIAFDIPGLVSHDSSGWILKGNQMDAHNTFESPDNVKKSDYSNFKVDETSVEIVLPPMSIVTLLMDIDE